jgi:hypothetical protein
MPGKTVAAELTGHPRRLAVLAAALLLTLGQPDLCLAAAPAVRPFAGNSGTTGLFDMPSARLMEDWVLRPHYSWSDPYGTYALTATVMPWLELNGRLIRISGLPSGLSSGYGDYKDKAVDFKLRLLEESGPWPALAFGAHDIHGTGLFSARYLVASKLLGPFDLSLGAGQGALAGEIMGGAGTGQGSADTGLDFLTSRPDRKTRPFGGVELRVNEELSLLAEYSSLTYENLLGMNEAAHSPINFGLKYRLGDNLELTASWQRGDRFGWSLSSPLPLEPEGAIPHRHRPFWVAGPELQAQAAGADKADLALIIRKEVALEGLSNVRVSVGDSIAWVEFENPTYQSQVTAMGRAMRAVASLVPPRITRIRLNLKANDLIVLSLGMNREVYEAYLRGALNEETLFAYSELDNQGNESRQLFLAEHPDATPISSGYYGSERFAWGIKPSWRMLLNDPSGFVKNNFSIAWKGTYYPWSGGQLRGMINTPIFNDISSSNTVEEREAVRTDFIEYEQQKEVRLEVLGFSQVVDLPDRWLVKAEAGFFESAFGGVGMEVYRPSRDGRWGIGLEGEWVRKRDIDNSFTFKDGPSYKTAFLNLHYRVLPEYGVDAGLKIGRFLAGDPGARLDLSRTYKYFTIGGWYTVTDTSRFTADYNQGYRDKGVYLTVPFSIFTDYDAPAQLNYALRPWTRDPGQTVSQIYSLYPMSKLGDPDEFRRRFKEFTER